MSTKKKVRFPLRKIGRIGQTVARATTPRPNVSWANKILGKCELGQLLNGQMVTRASFCGSEMSVKYFLGQILAV